MKNTIAGGKSNIIGMQGRRLFRFGKRTWAFLSALLVLVSIVLRYISASPKPVVYPIEGFAAESPFRAPLMVTNQGDLAARGVTVDCSVVEVRLEGNIVATGEPEARFDTPGSDDLNPGEGRTFTCSMITGPAQVESARISTVVSYKPSILPWHQERAFSFVAGRDKTGSWRWVEPPMNQPKE
jgi:hypothetical protein